MIEILFYELIINLDLHESGVTTWRGGFLSFQMQAVAIFPALFWTRISNAVFTGLERKRPDNERT